MTDQSESAADRAHLEHLSQRVRALTAEKKQLREQRDAGVQAVMDMLSLAPPELGERFLAEPSYQRFKDMTSARVASDEDRG